MNTLAVLKDVEAFLRKDLAHVTLTAKSKVTRAMLISKVCECIRNLSGQDTLDEFLEEQRETARRMSKANNLLQSARAVSKREVEDEYGYMDHLLRYPDHKQQQKENSHDTGSRGLGADDESYERYEVVPVSPKSTKEEDLNIYFTNAECDIFSYVYLENSVFGGKTERVGVVKEKRFISYRRPADPTIMLSFPLRGYNCTLRNKEELVSATFTAHSEGEVYKFFIDPVNVPQWAKVLKENSLSFTDATAGVPPPVPARPASTLQEGDGYDLPIFGNAAPLPPDPSRKPGRQPNHIEQGINSAKTGFKEEVKKVRTLPTKRIGTTISGDLSIFDGKWRKKWCLVENNQLYIYGNEERHDLKLELKGCRLFAINKDVSHKNFGFKIFRNGKEIVFVKTNTAEEMGKWVGVLNASGCTQMPENDPEYMSFENIQSVSTVPNEAFEKSRLLSQPKEQTSEDIYLDMTGVSLTPLSPSNPRKIIPPRPPGPFTSRTPSAPDIFSLNQIIKKRVGNKSTNGEEIQKEMKPDSGEVKAPTLADDEKKKRRMAKRRERKSNLSEADTISPTEMKQAFEIINQQREPNGDVRCDEGKLKVQTAPTKVDKHKRRKELLAELGDIKLKLRTLNVKKDELLSRIEEAPTEQERGRLRIQAEKLSEEQGKLQKDDINIKFELRVLKDADSQPDMIIQQSPPPQRAKSPVRSEASESVSQIAKMWEAPNRR